MRDAINLVQSMIDPNFVMPAFIARPSLKRKFMTMKCSDGSEWGVPVLIIAKNRARHYAHEFGGDIERSLDEDTIPMFNDDDYNIEDWAVNNMNWSDFTGSYVKLSEATQPDFESEWIGTTKDFR